MHLFYLHLCNQNTLRIFWRFWISLNSFSIFTIACMQNFVTFLVEWIINAFMLTKKIVKWKFYLKNKVIFVIFYISFHFFFARQLTSNINFYNIHFHFFVHSFINVPDFSNRKSLYLFERILRFSHIIKCVWLFLLWIMCCVFIKKIIEFPFAIFFFFINK